MSTYENSVSINPYFNITDENMDAAKAILAQRLGGAGGGAGDSDESDAVLRAAVARVWPPAPPVPEPRAPPAVGAAAPSLGGALLEAAARLRPRSSRDVAEM